MTEEDARALQLDISRAVTVGVIHVVIVVLALAALVQHAGGSVSDIAYTGPRFRMALAGPPLSIVIALLATPIVLATPLSGRAWVVPLIAAALGIAWVAGCGIVALASA